jgi:hypothetical protein
LVENNAKWCARRPCSDWWKTTLNGVPEGRALIGGKSTLPRSTPTGVPVSQNLTLIGGKATISASDVLTGRDHYLLIGRKGALPPPFCSDNGKGIPPSPVCYLTEEGMEFCLTCLCSDW